MKQLIIFLKRFTKNIRFYPTETRHKIHFLKIYAIYYEFVCFVN